MQTTTNYGLRKPELTDNYSVEDQNFNSELLDSKLREIEESSNAVKADLSTHTKDKANPHEVTKEQVGLGNVDNTSDADKPISTATKAELDKKALAEDLTAHTENTSNPHGVTKEQVGLGNVPDVATNNQTPTYTVAGSNTALTSGETLTVAFGKIAKAIVSLISHLADTTGHITSAERTAWNAKVGASGTVANATNAVNATNAGNADTLDGLHASSFIQTSQSVKVIVSTTAPADTTAVWIVPS